MSDIDDDKMRPATSEEARRQERPLRNEGRLLAMPLEDRPVKRIRTRRRRIRNYFGGAAELSSAAVTVSRVGKLVGIRLRVSGNTAKALDACERYVRMPEADDAAALCEALLLTLQLHLDELAVCIYYDPTGISDPVGLADKTLAVLAGHVPNLQYLASPKGELMERLRRKLSDLRTRPNNEIVDSALAQVRQKIEAIGLESESVPAATVPARGVDSLNRNTDRGALLFAAHWFVERARSVEGVRQIAFVGSICTDKPNPKDIDLVVVVDPDADLPLLAKYRRGAGGRLQRGRLGFDVFVVTDGKYVGRVCCYKEPWARAVCRAQRLRCSDKLFLCDTSANFTLDRIDPNDPPIVLFPEFKANTTIPDDIRTVFEPISC